MAGKNLFTADADGINNDYICIVRGNPGWSSVRGHGSRNTGSVGNFIGAETSIIQKGI